MLRTHFYSPLILIVIRKKMVENIIFYLIMLFFAFIGLGANWERRYSYTKTYILIFIFTPIVVLIINTYFFNIAAIFDIREIFSFLGRPTYGQLMRDGTAWLALIPIFGIIAYLTISLCLTLQIIKCITSR